jgi:hypothetical protein
MVRVLYVRRGRGTWGHENQGGVECPREFARDLDSIACVGAPACRTGRRSHNVLVCDTPDLVAAVCEAGALGFIGASYLTPAQIVETASAVRTRTARPFGINLFAPMGAAPEAPPDPGPMLRRVAPFFAEVGLPPPEAPAVKADSFEEQLAAALESGASVFSFTFRHLTDEGRRGDQGPRHVPHGHSNDR